MNPRKLPNAEDCKKTLNLLDYLRKSQCTKTIYSTNGFGQPFLAPEKPDACEKTQIGRAHV